MSIKIKAETRGFRSVKRAARRAADDSVGAVAVALYQKGEQIMSDSKRECPVDKGFLRSSGYVSPPSVLRSPVVQIGYGTSYAPWVHNISGRNHPVGKDHFLSDPINKHRSGFVRWIARKAKANIRAGKTRWGRGRHPTRPPSDKIQYSILPGGSNG